MKINKKLCKCGCNELADYGLWKFGHWNRGKKKSKELKEKLSKMFSGKRNPFYNKKHSKYNKIKHSIIMKNKYKNGELIPYQLGKNKFNCKSIMKISKKLKGRKIPLNIRLKISKKLKGYKYSKERNLKISNAMKGVKKPKKWIINRMKNNLFAVWKGKTLSKEHRRKIRLGNINYRNKILGNIHPWFNIKACNFFNILNEKLNLNGFHAKNNKEYYIEKLGYWVDYYEPKLNLVIEWNENNHYKNNKLTDKHFQRQNEIKRFLKCRFINIKQSIFNEQKILNKIKKIISE